MKKRKSHGVQESKFAKYQYEDSFKPVLCQLGQLEDARSFLVGNAEFVVPRELECLHETYKCVSKLDSKKIIRRTEAQILEGHVELLMLSGSKKDQKEFAVRVGKELHERLTHLAKLRKTAESSRRTMLAYKLKMKENEQHVAKLPEVTQRLYEEYLATEDKSTFPKSKLDLIPDVKTVFDIQSKFTAAKQRADTANHALELFSEGNHKRISSSA